MHGAPYDRRGFTIIELLVVMAVIAVFLGVLGTALSRNNPTVAIQGGQRTLAGLVTGARAQAILKQADVRLIVHNDPPLASDPPAVQQEKRERYLRFIGMVVRVVDPATGTVSWEPVNDGVLLPRGVYVVPPRGLNPPGSNPPATVISNNNVDWAHARRSMVALNTANYQFHSSHPAQNYFHIEFNGRGMINTGQFLPGNEGRLVIAAAQETPLEPRFENQGDSQVLGGMLRTYGSFTLVSDPDAFEDIK